MGKRREVNVVQKYLSEKVPYGGKVVSRKEMIADLQKLAAQLAPRDKKEQSRLVNIYLAGHGLRSRS